MPDNFEQLEENNRKVQENVVAGIEKGKKKKVDTTSRKGDRMFFGTWFQAFEKLLKDNNKKKRDFSKPIVSGLDKVGRRTNAVISAVKSLKFPEVKFPEVQKVEISNFPKRKKVKKVKVVNQPETQKVEITNWKLPKFPEFPKFPEIKFPKIPKVKFPKLQRISGSVAITNLPKKQKVELFNFKMIIEGMQLMVRLLEEIKTEIGSIELVSGPTPIPSGASPKVEVSSSTRFVNVTLVNVDTQYSSDLQDDTKKITVQARDNDDFRMATTSGKVATPTNPYLTVKGGTNYYDDNIKTTETLYFASDTAGQVIEIIEWK